MKITSDPKPTSSAAFAPDEANRLFKSGQHEEALKYVGLHAKQGSADAMLYLADYEYDRGNVSDSIGWVERVESEAANGKPDLYIDLSSAYRRGLGEGTPFERHAKSLHALGLAAENGYVACAHALMSNYLYGLNGAPVSKERFTHWANVAAALGSKPAQAALLRLDKWPDVTPRKRRRPTSSGS